MKKILILALSVLAGGNLRAEQREWTLGQCIIYALENNISVRSGGLQVEQKELDYDSARGRMLPAVSASASENFSFGRGLTADNTYTNSNTSSTSFGLGAEVPVFQGLQLSNGIKMSRLDLEAATADLDKVKDDIRVAVAQAYVQILYDLQLRRVAQAQAEHDAQLLEEAPEKLSPKELPDFVDTLCELETRNLDRMQEDISWFIKKYDYRFGDQPWKNSRDAVERTVNKLRGWCVGKEPNPEEKPGF